MYGGGRGWYWGWLGSTIALILGGALELVAIALAVRNYLGPNLGEGFQFATILALGGIAFVLLGLAARQNCGGCCDWNEASEAGVNVRLEK